MHSYNPRYAAIALIAGSVAGLATMALHPTGAEVAGNAQAMLSNTFNALVHALGIIGQGLVLAGALGLVLKLRDRPELAVAGYVFFALASVAILIAGVASGFVAASTLARLAGAEGERRAMMIDLFSYTGLVNQGFAKVSVVLTGMALLFWSTAIMLTRSLSRGLGAYGLAIGVLLPAAVLSGALRLTIHGYGIVVLADGVWLVVAALQLAAHGGAEGL